MRRVRLFHHRRGQIEAAEERQRPSLRLLSLYEKESRSSLLTAVCAGRIARLSTLRLARKIRFARALGKRIRHDGRERRTRSFSNHGGVRPKDAGKDCPLGRPKFPPHPPLFR